MEINIYQIYYDDASKAAVGSDFTPLDNRDGPQDWFEFWPILNFLRTHTLDPDDWYGFLSPKFHEKTGLTRNQLEAVMRKNSSADVALFSYNWPSLALNLNPWRYGDQFHSGLIARTEAFLAYAGCPADLKQVVCDFETSVNSNYIVARKPFWDAWRQVAETYFAYVEAGGPTHPDNHVVTHRSIDGYPFKAFIQERIACVVLLNGDFSVATPNYARDVPILTPRAGPKTRWRDGTLRFFLALSDGAKRLTRKTGFRGFLFLYRVSRSLAYRVWKEPNR